MKLFEYQAKEIFKEYAIPIPSSILCESVDEVIQATEQLSYPVVLKSQVLMGGRGKKGLIPIVHNRNEAEKEAARLLSSEYGVHRILVEKAISIESELYLSITVDPVKAKGIILISKEGGVEIETLAQEDATKIQREPFDLTNGLQNFQISELAYRFNLNKALTKELSSIIRQLYNIFIQFDAELVEINPLFITKQGNMIAGDGKIVIDENSMQRQPRFTRTREFYDSDMEYEAALQGIPYLQFDGDISLMCAGAGLTTTVFDLINYEGGSVANYLEFGGPNYRKAYEAMELCLRNTSKVILVVTFGTIARADVMAQGIVDAASRLHPDRPIVTCIRGTGEIEAVSILEKAGFTPLFDTEEAVREAVKKSKGMHTK